MLIVYAFMFISALGQPLLLIMAAVGGVVSRNVWLALSLGTLAGATISFGSGRTYYPVTLYLLNIAAGVSIALLVYSLKKLMFEGTEEHTAPE